MCVWVHVCACVYKSVRKISEDNIGDLAPSPLAGSAASTFPASLSDLAAVDGYRQLPRASSGL